MPSAIAATENSRAKIVLASMIGTSIEYFDFYAYLTASVLIFPSLFFPHESPLLAQVSSLATFGLAFFARPIGATVFGHFGDRYGRKSPLVASLLTMGVATFLIGLLPTYDSWGQGAAIALAVLRFVQGFGLGGEWSGAALIAIENAPKNKRAIYGTLPQLGAPLGFLASNLVFLILYLTLPTASFDSWGWRVPFLLSAVLVIIGLVIRTRLAESFVYASTKIKRPSVPLALVLRKHMGQVLRGVLLFLAPYMVFYFLTVFTIAYGTSPSTWQLGQKVGLGFGRTDFLIMLLVAMLFYMFMLYIGGRLADLIGRIRVMAAGFGGVLVFAVLIPLWFEHAQQPVIALLFLIVGFALSGLMSAPLGSYLPELFPTEVRYTGSALTNNLASILGAALAPLIEISLWNRSGGIGGIGVLLGVVTAISFLTVLFSRETKDLELGEIRGSDRTRPRLLRRVK